jgi:hypothetical protein
MMTTMTYTVEIRKTVTFSQTVVVVGAKSKKDAELKAQEMGDETKANHKTVGWRAIPESVTPVAEARPNEECPVCSNVGQGPLCKDHKPVDTVVATIPEVLSKFPEGTPAGDAGKALTTAINKAAQKEAKAKVAKRKEAAPKPGRQVSIGGALVELTAQEGQVLDELISNAMACSGGDFFILEESTPRGKEKAQTFGALVTCLQSKGAISVAEPTYVNDDGRKLAKNKVTQGDILVDNWKDGGAN